MEAIHRQVAALCGQLASAESERPQKDAENRLPDIIVALHRVHPPLCACAPIAALRILGSKVDSYSYGVLQPAASAWLAAPGAEAAAELTRQHHSVAARLNDVEAREAVDAAIAGLRDPAPPTAAIECAGRFAQFLTRCRFVPVLSPEQGRRLLAWRTLDEALSWALGRDSRVARPRGFAPGRYFAERRDEGNWFNNDIEHFVVDAWTGDWVLTFYGNERNSSDTYEGCSGVRIDEAKRQVIVSHYAPDPEQIVPLPEESR